MSDYNFSLTKDQLINLIKSVEDFTKVFIVRNIRSRFAIYVLGSKNFVALSAKINANDIFKWVDLIEEITEKDSFIYDDLNINSVKITDEIFYSERHVDNSNWFLEEEYKELKTPVTSFYSFKGGVGRTTATVLTALLLARTGKKVVIIDFDLEAPGLASIFSNSEDKTEDLLSVKGFIDFLIDFDANKRQISELRIDDYYFVKNEQILVGNNGGEIVIVPAISTDSDSSNSFIDKLSKANLKFGFSGNYIPDVFLREIEKKVKPDHIFIDTRTGINDIGGIVFNRYAQNIFLIFYGNRQNMFGLESMINELKDLNNKGVNFYLVNSPVPKNPTDSKLEVNYFVEKSYEIFCTNIYDENNIPSQFDETADHYPINIPFDEQALLLSNYKKISSLIDNINNPYEKLADIIKNKNEAIPNIEFIDNIDSSDIIDIIINIDRGSGTSEIEFKTSEDLKKLFYPRKDYRYIFDTDKFLILGEKGVGKTALFSVLSHREYAINLAEFCGVNHNEMANKKWVIGLDKDKSTSPSKEHFESLNKFTIAQMRYYWMILLIRQIEPDLIQESFLKSEIKNSKIKDLRDIAIRPNIGEELFELLEQTDQNLITANETLIFVYDHLDAILSNEGELRGKLISALLTFFYDNIVRLSNIKAKIFLRQDIFDREVNDINDKVKIKTYITPLTWDYNQLLNIIWKRLYEQKENISLFNGFKFEHNVILGSIPNVNNEQDQEVILDRIFGKNMGGNNKAYPYNWIKLHIEDTNNQIHPRTLIKLFSESAKLQKEDIEQPKDRIIKSKNIEKALRDKVSPHQVQELKEEYPELEKVLSDLASKVGGRSPIIENDLESALIEIGVEPIETIKKLKDIGVLKDYKPIKDKQENEERRYHIPDLYLFGLNLTRKGTK